MITKIKSLLFSSTSKDTFASMIGNVGIAVGGMLFTVICARSLSPDNFGIFSALLALATLVSSIGELGIPAALINFLPKLPDDRSTLVSVTFWFQLATSLVFSLLVFSLITVRHIVIPGASIGGFVLVALLVLVGVIEGFTQGLLKAEKKFILASALWILDSFTKLALLFGLFLNHKVTIESAILVSLISGSIATAIAISREFKNIRWVFPKQQFNQIYLFSRWIALTRVFSVGVGRFDVLFLNSLGSSYQAGIFAAASRITLVFSVVVSSLGNVVAPRFSSFNRNDQMRSYLKKLSLLILAVSGGMLLCAVLAQPIISFVFGDKYLDAIPVFQLLTVAMIPFLFTIVTINPLIYTYNHPHFVALVTAIQTVTIVVLDVLLIPRLGAYAPPISLAVSNIIVLTMTGWKLRKLLSD